MTNTVISGSDFKFALVSERRQFVLKMKVLVTGGAGFIGSALIRHLIKNTCDSVVNVDKLTYAGNLENLREIETSGRYVFEQLDICNSSELERVFCEHQPDAVMHLAAESHVDRSISSANAFIETNIVGTYRLLEVVRKYWTNMSTTRKQSFRFHHISTDEVYGDLPHPADFLGANSHRFSEDTAYNPSSPYSASKASSDHLVKAWSKTYGLPALLTHCTNNYGPYHHPEKLVPRVIFNALKGTPIPIFGSGDQIRDWLYVEDHVRALYQVVTQGEVGQTYNISAHNEKPNIEVALTICDILQKLAPVKRLYRDLITHVKDRPGHDRRYAVDASKIMKSLDWAPLETFDSGILKTVQWYLDNPEWCRHMQDGAPTSVSALGSSDSNSFSHKDRP